MRLEPTLLLQLTPEADQLIQVLDKRSGVDGGLGIDFITGLPAIRIVQEPALLQVLDQGSDWLGLCCCVLATRLYNTIRVV